MKNYLLLFIVLFVAQAINAQPVLNPCMLDQSIDISTGYDHANGTHYMPVGTVLQKDEYWSLVDGEAKAGLPFPQCATVAHWWACSTRAGMLVSGSSLQYGQNNQVDKTMNSNCGSCGIFGNTNRHYVFERQFKLELGGQTSVNGMLDIRTWADDKILKINIIGPVPGAITGLTPLTNVNCTSHQCTDWTPTFTFNASGVYKLQITVGVKGSGPGCNASGSLQLQVSGNIRASLPGHHLVKNEFFGKRTTICAPAYACPDIYQTDLIGSPCVAPNTTGLFTLTPHCPSTTYLFDDGMNTPISNTGNTVTLPPGNYTMTATDANNCTYTRNFDIGNPSIAPIASQCITPGTTVAVNPVTSSYAPITDMQVNAGGWQSPFTPYLGVGNHTIEVRDANGCIASENFDIGNLFTTSLSASPTCFNPTATLTATNSPTGVVGPLNYSYFWGANPLGTTTSNTQTVSNGGNYSVMVTDAFGCSASNTVTAIPEPVFTYTLSDPCIPTTLTVSAGPVGGTYTYSLDGGPYQSSNVFNITNSGSHTINVQSAPGCDVSQTFSVLAAQPCCITLAQLTNSSLVIPHGTSQSQIAATTGPIYSSVSNIIIEGDYIVDQDFTFLNCPNIIMNPNAHIIVDPTVRFRVESSVIRAGCSSMWKGITQDDPAFTQISYLEIINSTLMDMEDGVRSINGANLIVKDNTFTRNNVGIQIIESDPGYSYANGRCDIQGNTFTSNLSPLLSPYTYKDRGEHGIKLISCYTVDIGIQSNSIPSNPNNFSNIYNGIYIEPDVTGHIDQYHIADFNMTNITAGISEADILNKAYTYPRGSAIFCPSGKHSTNIYQDVKIIPYSNSVLNITNCDKAVVLNGINSEIQYLNADNCMVGALMGSTDGHNYDFAGLNINNSFISAEFAGDANDVRVQESIFDQRTDAIISTSGDCKWPKGISVIDPMPNTSTLDLSHNYIYMKSIGGEAIDLSGLGPNALIYYNTIQFTSTNLSDPVSPYNSAYLKGIAIKNTELAQIKENTINGQPSFTQFVNDYMNNVITDRRSTGIYVDRCIDLEINCNFMDNTIEGLYIMDYCNTGPDKVSGNSFNDHYIPIYFTPNGGNEGTLGDVGTPSDNNNNTYGAGDDPSLPAPQSGFKLWRYTLASIPSGEQYYSHPSILPSRVLQSEISSGPGLNDYIAVQNAPGFNIPPPCINGGYTYSIIQPGGGSSADERAIAVAEDSVQYSNYPEVSEWMDERALLEVLYEDPAYRASDTRLQSFYNSVISTTKEDIRAANKAIGSLADSSLRANSTLWEAQYQLAESANNAISSSKQYELNEKEINRLLLLNMKFGVDSLSMNDSSFICNLADQCPYVSGTAVHKARTLRTLYGTGYFYDDKKICNAVGVYKTDNPNDERNIVQIIKNTKVNHGITGSITIYPNPTSGAIEMKYELPMDGELLFYDMLGREMQRVQLNAAYHNDYASLNLPNGVYTWVCQCSGQTIANGKLIKR